MGYTPGALPIGSFIYLNTTIKLSEHNRQPVSITPNRIEKSTRMSNGTLRKFYIDDKHTINMSWNMLPSYSTFTVDGGYGALDLKSFYEGTAAKASGALSGQNTFDVTVRYGAGATTETYTMIFTSCSFEVIKRNAKIATADTPQELWNVSLSMEEV
jgi:hypothetical protein